MAILCDYFSAKTDDAAASILDLDAGPTSAAGFPSVRLPGIEPTITMQTLEELLTGRSEDDVMENPRQGEILADGPSGAMVVAITGELQAALASADDETLRRVAVDWSHTEEMDGSDPTDVAEGLIDLADLARIASGKGEQLYCWLSE